MKLNQKNVRTWLLIFSIDAIEWEPVTIDSKQIEM